MQSEFVNLKIQLDTLRTALSDAFDFGASGRYVSELNRNIDDVHQRIFNQLNFITGTGYN